MCLQIDKILGKKSLHLREEIHSLILEKVHLSKKNSDHISFISEKMKRDQEKDLSRLEKDHGAILDKLSKMELRHEVLKEQ